MGETYRAIDGVLKKQIDSPIDEPIASLKAIIEDSNFGARYRKRQRGLRTSSLLTYNVPYSFYHYSDRMEPATPGWEGDMHGVEYSRAARRFFLKGNLSVNGKIYSKKEILSDYVNSQWRRRDIQSLIRLEESRYKNFLHSYLPSHYRMWCQQQDARYNAWSRKRKRLIHQYELEHLAFMSIKPREAKAALKRLNRVLKWKFRWYNYCAPTYRYKYVDLERGTCIYPGYSVPVGLPSNLFYPCNHQQLSSFAEITRVKGTWTRHHDIGYNPDEYWNYKRSFQFDHVLQQFCANGGYAWVQPWAYTWANTAVPRYNERIDSLNYTDAQLRSFVAGHLPQTMEKLSLFEIVADLKDAYQSLSKFLSNWQETAQRLAALGTPGRRRPTVEQLRTWSPIAHHIALASKKKGMTVETICRYFHIPFSKHAKGGAQRIVQSIYEHVKRNRNAFAAAQLGASLAIDNYQFYRFAVKSGVRDGISVGSIVFSEGMGEYGTYIKRIFNALGQTQTYHVLLRDTSSSQLITLDPSKSNGQFNVKEEWSGGLRESTSVTNTMGPAADPPVTTWVGLCSPVWRVRTRRVERATVTADASLVNFLGLDVNPYSMLTQGYLMFHYLGLSASGFWQSIRYTYIIDKVFPWIRNFLENPAYSFIGLEYRVHSFGESCKEDVYISYVDHGSHYHDHQEYVDDLGFREVVDLDVECTTAQSSIPSGKEVLFASRYRRSRLNPGANSWHQSSGKECTPQWWSFLTESAVSLAQRFL